MLILLLFLPNIKSSADFLKGPREAQTQESSDYTGSGWSRLSESRCTEKSDKNSSSQPITLPHRHVDMEHGYGSMQQMEYSITDWIRGKIRLERGRTRRSWRVMYCHWMKRGRRSSNASLETSCKVDKYLSFSLGQQHLSFFYVIRVCDFLTGSVILKSILQRVILTLGPFWCC